MVEPAVLAGQLMPYALAAVGAYRGAVLDEAEDHPAEATATLGRRLLRRIFNTHKAGEPLPGPLADAVANPLDEDIVAALRLRIRKALTADPQLRTDVEGILAEAGTIDQRPAPFGELSQSLIGQAAVGVTLVAAFIYAGGALTLIFKLWYLRVPWTSVLGQLPHDFIITTAFGQVILPTLVLAALLTVFSIWYLNWYRKLQTKKVQRRADRASQESVASRWSWPKQLGIFILGFLGGVIVNIVFSGAVIGLLSLILLISQRYVPSNLLRDPIQIYLLCAACIIFALLLFLYIYKVIYPSKIGNTSKHILSLCTFVIALLPTVAAVSAATLLPVVTLCGPSFHNVVHRKDVKHHKMYRKDVNWIRGDLIGSNSDSIFIAQWQRNSDGEITSKNIIAVVPRSIVKAEIIGSADNCTDVTKPKPTTAPSKSHTR